MKKLIIAIAATILLLTGCANPPGENTGNDGNNIFKPAAAADYGKSENDTPVGENYTAEPYAEDVQNNRNNPDESDMTVETEITTTPVIPATSEQAKENNNNSVITVVSGRISLSPYDSILWMEKDDITPDVRDIADSDIIAESLTELADALPVIGYSDNIHISRADGVEYFEFRAFDKDFNIVRYGRIPKSDGEENVEPSFFGFEDGLYYVSLIMTENGGSIGINCMFRLAVGDVQYNNTPATTAHEEPRPVDLTRAREIIANTPRNVTVSSGGESIQAAENTLSVTMTEILEDGTEMVTHGDMVWIGDELPYLLGELPAITFNGNIELSSNCSIGTPTIYNCNNFNEMWYYECKEQFTLNDLNSAPDKVPAGRYLVITYITGGDTSEYFDAMCMFVLIKN